MYSFDILLQETMFEAVFFQKGFCIISVLAVANNPWDYDRGSLCCMFLTSIGFLYTIIPACPPLA